MRFRVQINTVSYLSIAYLRSTWWFHEWLELRFRLALGYVLVGYICTSGWWLIASYDNAPTVMPQWIHLITFSRIWVFENFSWNACWEVSKNSCWFFSKYVFILKIFYELPRNFSMENSRNSSKDSCGIYSTALIK